MATTTTIEPDKDTYLWNANLTANYGTQTTMKSGTFYTHGDDTCYNMVMEFDVSAYTDPSAIIQADLTLIEQSTTGTLTRTITVSRLGLTFTEANPDGCNWQDNGARDWNGAVDYKETDVPSQTFVVGSGQSDVTIDLIEFMRDAITRRSGILRIGFYETCIATLGNSGFTKFWSSRAPIEANKPELEITVAERIVWDNAMGTGVLSTDGNWVGGVAPDIADFAMFTNGSEDGVSGNILCHSFFIGSEYTGQIGLVDAKVNVISGTDYENFRRVINKKRGQFFINDIVSGLITTKIYISDAPTGSVYERTNTATAIVTGGDLELQGQYTLVASRAKNVGTKIKLTETMPVSIIASHCKLTLDEGTNTGIYLDGTKVTTDGILLGVQTISGNSTLVYRGKTIAGTCTIYKGRLSFHKNENGEISTSYIYLYKGAVFDSRTGTAAWNPTTTPSVNIKGGGNLMVDAGKTIALGT